MPENNTLKIQTLGTFALFYNDMPVTLERNSAANAAHIFQYLVYNLGTEVSKHDLINAVFSFEKTDNPSNNLKANLFRLRKLIQSSPLPDGEYIITKSGSYILTPPVPFEADCKLFESHISRSQSEYITSEQKLHFLKQAASVYTGEFLPHLSHIPWVKEVREKYRTLYLSCIKSICQILKTTENFTELLPICIKAAEIYPYDEDFLLLKLSCLIDMKNNDGAKAEYSAIVKRFFEDRDTSPSEKIHSLFLSINRNTNSGTLTIKETALSLSEKNTNKAYNSNISSFTDTYRFVSRIAKNNNRPLYLTLFTITDTQGNVIESSDRLNGIADILQKVIGNTLGSNALYTKYSINQFLVLHADTSHEDCIAASKSVISAFNEYKFRGIRLTSSSTLA